MVQGYLQVSLHNNAGSRLRSEIFLNTPQNTNEIKNVASMYSTLFAQPGAGDLLYFRRRIKVMRLVNDGFIPTGHWLQAETVSFPDLSHGLDLKSVCPALRWEDCVQ